MALLYSTLYPGILAAVNTPLLNPLADLTDAYAKAYAAYALAAQSVVGVPASLVNEAGLRSGLTTFFISIHPDPASAATAFAAPFQTYWTGALFGATGYVSYPGDLGTFVSSLSSNFASNIAAGLAVTPDQVAAQLTTALDVFTRTVLAGDTALPSPPGTPPAPIV
jgi:hypothetical protein